jgi:hypothetical protein
MPPITAGQFWDLYREALRLKGSWLAYESDQTWSPIALGAAEESCKKMGLKTQREYLRIDVIGYESRSAVDWDLRVAFEHENRDDWKDELCKLTHVVADLCVLASYHNFNSAEPLSSVLQAAVDKIKFSDRNRRVTGRQWLFIFGPRCVSAEHAFHALTLDPQGKVADLEDAKPLTPKSWQ